MDRSLPRGTTGAHWTTVFAPLRKRGETTETMEFFCIYLMRVAELSGHNHARRWCDTGGNSVK